MITQQPFWVIRSPKCNNLEQKHKDWQVYSTDAVIEGKSPLLELGLKCYQHTAKDFSIYDRCFWVFYKRINQTTDKDLQSLRDRSLRSLAFATYRAESSSCSYIIRYNEDLQTFTFPRFTENPIFTKDINHTSLLDEVENILSLPQEKALYYTELWEYLANINKSPRFIRELALWSFLEHHWAPNKNTSNHISSLDKLLSYVFSEKEEKQRRKELKRQFFKIGASLGKEYDENHLRNILAHGKHFTLKENWTDENWQAFYVAHQTLNDLVCKGISKEISSLLE